MAGRTSRGDQAEPSRVQPAGPDTDLQARLETGVGPTAPAPLLAGDRPAITAWPLDPHLIHLNHGSFGAVPRAALTRQAELREEMERAPVHWFVGLLPKIAAAREAIAAFLRVEPADTALVPNASAGVTVALRALADRARPDVVVTDHEYGAVRMAAERAAARAGGRCVVVPIPLAAGGDEVLARLTEALTDRTGVLVVDQLTSASARLFPVGPVCAAARARGVRTIVDGAHAPGSLASPVPDPRGPEAADVWVGNLHKWACAPRGTAALVANPAVAGLLRPVIDSWGADEPFPARFDAQGTLDATPWLAAPAALAWIEATWGWEAVRGYGAALAGYALAVIGAAMSEATGTDCRVDVGSPAPLMRLVRLPQGLARTRLEADGLRAPVHDDLGIEVAVTSLHGQGYLRLSTHAYLTATDIDDVAERLPRYLVERAAAVPR